MIEAAKAAGFFIMWLVFLGSFAYLVALSRGWL